MAQRNPGGLFLLHQPVLSKLDARNPAGATIVPVDAHEFLVSRLAVQLALKGFLERPTPIASTAGLRPHTVGTLLAG